MARMPCSRREAAVEGEDKPVLKISEARSDTRAGAGRHPVGARLGTHVSRAGRTPVGTRRSLALPPSGGAAAVAWVGRCLLKSRNCVRLHRVPFECPPASSRHYSWVYLAAKRSTTWATPCYLCCTHGLRALAYLRRMMTVGSRAHRLRPPSVGARVRRSSQGPLFATQLPTICKPC